MSLRQYVSIKSVCDQMTCAPNGVYLLATLKIESCRKEQPFSTLLADPLRADAITFNLLIIGEAAGKLPIDLREAHPQIPWRQVVGLRNVIAHQYFRLDLEIIWDVVEEELPELRRAVEAMLMEAE